MNKTLSGVCESSAIVTLLLCFCIRSGIAAERIRIATGGLAASSAAVWAGLETKSFQKYGLEPEYIIIDNGTVSGQALLAGIEQTVGKKDGVTPEALKLTDRSVLEEVIKTGFVSSLYK